jgi:hypothetical protein
MRLPIQRIDTYTVPATGSVAESVERYVAGRVAELVADMPENSVLDVTGTPRGDYVEVMIYVKPEARKRVEDSTEPIGEELRKMGVSTAFYVKTWTGVS